MTRKRLTLTSAPDVLKLKEAAEVLRIGKNQATAGVRSGAIPSVRIGNSIRVLKSSLVALLEGQTTQ